MGVLRSSFLVGADGRIEMGWPKVKPDQHPEEVLDYLRNHRES
jgi:peroxiredoxin